MRTQFNTGRYYTAKGQRIVAKVVEDGILFNDLDRCIAGFIPLLKVPEDVPTLKEVTMFNYDHGNYRGEVEAINLNWEEP